MQKIIPNIWFDHEANRAAEFYRNIFPDAAINHSRKFTNTSAGDFETVSFQIFNYHMTAVSAERTDQLNPSISFFLKFTHDEEDMMDAVWHGLNEEGFVMMPLDSYDFSPKFGWIMDKFGVTWQLSMTDEADERVSLCMMFVQENLGKAQDAITHYTETFRNSEIISLEHIPESEMVMVSENKLAGQSFVLMDSPGGHEFNFNELFSLTIQCEDQNEIDYFWEKLSHHKDSGQFGRAEDRFGVSWQIVPARLEKFLYHGEEDKVHEVLQNLMKMEKIDIDALGDLEY